MQKFNRKPNKVTAIQLEGDLTYLKWGGEQKAHKGDYLVNNNGDVYTIEKQSFNKTYKWVVSNSYSKFGSVWGFEASYDGAMSTKEGISEYKRGDYIVFNNEDETDGYCIKAEKFKDMYEPGL